VRPENGGQACLEAGALRPVGQRGVVREHVGEWYGTGQVNALVVKCDRSGAVAEPIRARAPW
jgi:hypothetical protein